MTETTGRSAPVRSADPTRRTKDRTVTANQQQSEAWNGSESVHWVDNADRYDRQFAPLGDALLADLAAGPHRAVLDVGCGCGAVALEAAHLSRRVVGADISGPLVAVATDRARAKSIGNVEFLVADAQTYPFEEGSFDVVISQLGLMFFDQPETAFENLRRVLEPKGRITFTCWQGIEANEWVTVIAASVAEHAVVPPLGGVAAGPGMFSLKNPDEIAVLLDQVGFAGVGIESLSPTVLIGGGGTLDESVTFLLGTGIARGLLSHAAPDTRASAVESIRARLAERYESGVGVRMGAAAWLVSAVR